MEGNRYGGSSSEWFVAVNKGGAFVRPVVLPTVTFWSGPPEDLDRIMYDDLRSLADPDTPINKIQGLADGTLPEFIQPDKSVTRMWASPDGGVTGTWITTTTVSKAGASGRFADLEDAPAVPAEPGDIGAATAAQGEKADAALPAAELPSQMTAVLEDESSSFRQSASATFVPRAEQVALNDLPLADPLDGSEFVPVWQGGQNRRVTTDDLAGLSTVIHVPAGVMFSASGSPSLSVVNRHQAWLLDPNVNEAVGFNAAAWLPEHWSTFHIDVVWINAAAGAGAVTFRADYSIEADGAAIANPTTGSVIVGTHTAAAQNVRTRSTITNTVNAPTAATDSMPMALFRMATNGTDTLPNDCGVLEVLLVRET